MCQWEFSSARYIDPTKYGVLIARDTNGRPWHYSTRSLTAICGGFYHDSQAQINFKSSLRSNILCTCQRGPVFLESKPLIWIGHSIQSSEGLVLSVKIRKQRNWKVCPQTRINMATMPSSCQEWPFGGIEEAGLGSFFDTRSAMASVFF